MPLILIVDDNPGDRELAGFALDEIEDVRVSHAADGVEGIDSVRSETPDLVLTDLRMPQMDGLELVKQVKAEFPEVPIILMTSDGSEQVAVEALRHGAASYVSKNTMADHLAATVKQVLAVAQSQKHKDYLRSQITYREVNFKLSNDPDLIPPLISYLLDELGPLFEGDSMDRTPIGMALQEALHNALYHGNLELSSDLRETDISNYFDLADIRRQQDPFADRSIHVTVREGPDQAEYIVRDEGPGFDPTAVPDPTAPENMERVSGRGLLLIRTFMDEVHFNATGNEVRMVKRHPDRMPQTQQVAAG